MQQKTGTESQNKSSKNTSSSTNDNPEHLTSSQSKQSASAACFAALSDSQPVVPCCGVSGGNTPVDTWLLSGRVQKLSSQFEGALLHNMNKERNLFMVSAGVGGGGLINGEWGDGVVVVEGLL